MFDIFHIIDQIKIQKLPLWIGQDVTWNYKNSPFNWELFSLSMFILEKQVWDPVGGYYNDRT